MVIVVLTTCVVVLKVLLGLIALFVGFFSLFFQIFLFYYSTSVLSLVSVPSCIFFTVVFHSLCSSFSSHLISPLFLW